MKLSELNFNPQNCHFFNYFTWEDDNCSEQRIFSIVHLHGVNLSAKVQQVLDGLAHTSQVVRLSAVRLVVGEYDAVRLRVVAARHSQHHDLTWACLRTTMRTRLEETLRCKQNALPLARRFGPLGAACQIQAVVWQIQQLVVRLGWWSRWCAWT